MALKKGFTLIEILIVTGLIGLISIVFSWSILSKKTGSKISNENISLYNAKKAMTELNNTLLNISNIIEIGDDEIIAKDLNDKHFSFYINEKNDLIKASLKGIDEKIVTTNIKNLKFKLLIHKNYKLLKFEIVMFDNFCLRSSVFLRYYK